MKKSMKFATALAGAAVVVAGGTAFTGSNTVPVGTNAMGYNDVTVSGLDVTEVLFDYDDANTTLETVTFNAVNANALAMVVANSSAVFQLSGPATPDAINCTPTAHNSAVPARDGITFTCNVTGNADVEDIDGYTLAVTTDKLA